MFSVKMKSRVRAATTALYVIGLASGTTATLRAGTWAIKIIPAGPEQLLFDWRYNRCDEADTPDAPPRAFRDDKGFIHLYASHDVSRELVGNSFRTLMHECRISYQGRHEDNPSKYDDRQWLTAFATTDGRRIAAVVHNEFHGHLRPKLCPSKDYKSCWWNSLTFAKSDDGGYTFTSGQAPGNLIAAVPYVYQGDVGHPVGYFQPTNIVKNGRYFYMIFLATAYRDQEGGSCLARTDNIFEPSSWKAWDGSAFNVSFIDPDGNTDDVSKHVCQPLPKGRFFNASSLSFDTTAESFILLSSIAKENETPQWAAGAYISISKNLTDWSGPTLVASDADLRTGTDGETYIRGFYSLIDENSEDFDFGTISTSPVLFLYYVKFDRRKVPLSRILVKRPVELTRCSETTKC
jgi:hypothetical protein